MSELAQNYAAAGFGGRLGVGQVPALLVVDALRGYVDPTSPFCADVHDTVAVIRTLVDRARTAGVPVVFTRLRHPSGVASAGLWARKVPNLVGLMEPPFGEFIEGLEPGARDLVVEKQYASAFFGTTLASSLTAGRIDTLLVTGFTTSGCIRATAVDALQHGFAPLVVRDGVGDRHRAPHESNLFDLEAKYADVVDAATAWDVIGGAGGDGASASPRFSDRSDRTAASGDDTERTSR